MGLGAVHVLHLFRSLPEEEVGTDGGAENAHDHGGGGAVRREGRPDRMKGDLIPRHMHGEENRRIGQKRKGQPFEKADIAMVGLKHLERQGRGDKEQGHQVAIDAGDQFSHLAHGRHVGGDVEGIGDEKENDDADQDRLGKGDLDIGRKTPSRDPPDSAAHRLDGGHQREGQRHGPQHVEAKLRASLGIGGDTAGIVVGDPGDQAGSHPGQGVGLYPLPDFRQASPRKRHWKAPARTVARMVRLMTERPLVSSAEGIIIIFSKPVQRPADMGRFC